MWVVHTVKNLLAFQNNRWHTCFKLTMKKRGITIIYKNNLLNYVCINNNWLYQLSNEQISMSQASNIIQTKFLVRLIFYEHRAIMLHQNIRKRRFISVVFLPPFNRPPFPKWSFPLLMPKNQPIICSKKLHNKQFGQINNHPARRLIFKTWIRKDVCKTSFKDNRTRTHTKSGKIIS